MTDEEKIERMVYLADALSGTTVHTIDAMELPREESADAGDIIMAAATTFFIKMAKHITRMTPYHAGYMIRWQLEKALRDSPRSQPPKFAPHEVKP